MRRRPALASPGSLCLLAMLLLFLPGAVSLAEPPTAPQALRESAVRQARNGDPKGALHQLQELVRSYPDDPHLLADTAIVANWAGDDSYVLEIYAREQTPKDDPGVVEAAARSARNLHRYDQALPLFQRAESLAPDRWQPRLGYAMVLTDQGHLSAAADLMKPLLLKEGDEPDVERGEAYLCLRQQDYACSIAMYQRLLKQIPQDAKGIHCQIAHALSQLGGDTLAEDTCDISGGAEKLRLEAATGAERIRWAESIDHDWQRRKTDAEQALATLNGVIAASQPADEVWRQAQFDRLLALYDLYRMREVVQSWEQLHKLGIKVPDYALARVAGAYLTLRHPQEAEGLYRALVERSPEDGDLWGGLAYAQFESEHIPEAFQTIDQAYRNSPAWLQSPGLKVPQPNSDHASLGLQAAQMRGYAGMHAGEQTRLEQMLGMAPASPDLGRAMALNDLARGWPLLAMREERMADSFEQKSDLPVLEDAQVLEGAGRRKEVDAMLGLLLKREGHSPAVDRFLSERAIERGWQASVLAGYEWSNGQYLGNSLHSEAYLYSPFINDRWRVYAHALGDSGKFTRGSAYRSRAAAGISYSYNRQSFWGEAAGDSGTAGAVAAGAAGAQFSMGDHWILGAQGDTDNLTDVQLIAQLAGVRVRSGRVNIEWRQSELSSVRIGLQRMLFSDGNQRSAVSGVWDQRILTQPRLQIDLTPQVWASANSKDQSRLYYNPKHDASAGLASQVNWVTWRRYDRSLRQQFTVYAGPYWEDHYGFNSAVSAGYTQQWQISKRLGFFGKVAWNGQPYDGSREPYTDLIFGLTWGNQ